MFQKWGKKTFFCLLLIRILNNKEILIRWRNFRQKIKFLRKYYHNKALKVIIGWKRN